MTTQSQSLRLADDVAGAPLLWPGLYPRYAIANDGMAICHHCCRTERQQIATTTGTDGWCLVATAVNFEDRDLYCSHCGCRIGSTYADDVDADDDFREALTPAERNPSLVGR